MLSQDILTRGLRTDEFDTGSVDHTVSFALNAVHENIDGDSFKVQNEEGNTLVYSVPYTIIGTINIGRRKTVIFSTNNEDCEIGIEDNNTYTTLINHPDLNFSLDQPVKGLYKTLNGCETYIYFTDGSNPDRVVNIDDLDSYKNPDGTWDIELLRLQRAVSIPYVIPTQVNDSGGILQLGKYSFVIEILDDELNPVQKSYISDGVNIYDDSISSPYDVIDGGFNLDDINAASGGVPQTSKSINLQFANLDTSYSFIRLYVIVYNTGDGLTPAVYQKGQLIPIGNSTEQYVFTGIDFNSDIESNIQAVTTRNPVWTTSQDMKIVNNRLVRANLRDLADVDYKLFQTYANSIEITPVKKLVPVKDQSQSSNSKNPLDYAFFQQGEVYALGAVYIFKQGFVSPVFHIPGRTAIGDELTLVTLTEDKPHFGKVAGDTIEKWKLEPAYSSTRMGYYETTTKYPETKCGGQYIFGNLVGQYIRHHRFPDLTNENPLYRDGSIHGFGIEVSNVQYPHPDIVGHYIVYGKRDELNRMVHDTVAYTRRKVYDPNDNIIYLTEHTNDFNPASTTVSNAPFWRTDVIQFFSPKMFMNDMTGNGKYLQQAYHIRPERTLQEQFIDTAQTTDAIDISSLVYRYDYLQNPVSGLTFIDDFNIERSIKLGPSEILPNGSSVFTSGITNRSRYNKFNVCKLNKEMDYINPIPGEDGFIATSHIRMGVLKQANFNIHGNLFAINYTSLHDEILTNSSSTIYGGDTYVGPFSFESIYDDFNNQFTLYGYHVKDVVFSSEINAGLRHGGSSNSTSIFKGDTTNELSDFTLAKFGDITDEGKYSENPKPIQFLYNDDYSTLNPNIFFSLPISYNYCSDCIGYYPNHIVWSDRQFLESINDEFRSYLNENYTIVGEDTGEISSIYYDGKTLWVHTWESLYSVYPNPQVLQTDVNSVYLGTGDFLSLPPNQFSKTDYGYAGSKGRFAHVDTEFGRLYVDSGNGTVFLISSGIEELSSKKYGNQRFFRENLPFAFPVELEEYFPMDSIISGVGIKCIYDPSHKRAIIYKRDFYPINYQGLYDGQTTNGLYYSTRIGKFISVENGQNTVVTFGNPDYFENRSFSISFSFEMTAWVSFHSWFPSWAYNDALNLYSCVGNNVWEHTSKSFNTYYGSPVPFIVEFIAMSQNGEPSDIDCIDYYAYTREWNAQNKTWSKTRFPTFDKCIVYTDEQSTGLLNLIPKDMYSPFFRGDEAVVAYATDHYRVNQIHNMQVDNPNFSKAWNDILGQYYIDKVPININPNLSQYYITPIKSRFWRIRLFYNSAEKIILDLVRTIHRNRSL